MNYTNSRNQIKYGLSAEQVADSRSSSGSNSLTEKKRHGFFHRLLESFSDPIIKILLLALAANLILMLRRSSWYEAVGIAAAVFISTFVSTISEYGSELAFRKLKEEAAKTKCQVRRGGRITELPISDIVVGDVVLLSAGDAIPADGVMLEGELGVDQSALNGESRETIKHPQKGRTGFDRASADDLHAAEQLFRGSTVAFGEGVMLVCRVGDATFYGRLASELQEDAGESPLKERLAKLAASLSKIGYIAAVLVAAADLFNLLVLQNGLAELSAYTLTSHILHALTLGITVVVVAVPEGLPMMIALVLSSNMFVMLKNNVMVRKLVGVETAGSMNILFTDKTGTLTRGKLKVIGIIDRSGTLQKNLRKLDHGYRRLLELSLSQNNGSSVAEEEPNGRKLAVGGNATDRALLEYVLPLEYGGDFKKEYSIPFDSSRKFSAVKLEYEGRKLWLIKGAPEKLLPHCSLCVNGSGEFESFSNTEKSAVLRKMNELTRQSARIVAVVCADRLGVDKLNAGSFSDLAYLGLAVIRDELRPEAAAAVSELRGAGIQVVMVTGDNRETAEAVAESCGILGHGSEEQSLVLSGSELAKMSDNELKSALPRLRIVARALPSDKSRLVRLAKELELVTGMTGDGVNDAPALKKADIGFAMGNGAEIAKEAGDIVILDNNIASISRAVLYGRTVFKSIRKFIVFQLTMNLCAVGVSLICPFIGIDAPVTVIQMLWINIIMDTLAGLAFAGEPPLREYMKEKPKSRREPVLNGRMANQILVTGGYTVLLSIAFLKLDAFTSRFRAADDDIYLLTAFFALFIFCGIFNSFNSRTERINLLAHLKQNPSFILIMLLVAAVQLLMVYFGGSVFRTGGLTSEELGLVLLLSASVIPVDIIRKIILRLNR